MSQSNSVQHFENVKDVLLYVACSGREVSTSEIAEQVLDINKGALNLLIRRLVKAEYLVSNGLHTHRAYTATDKTKQLFGIELPNMEEELLQEQFQQANEAEQEQVDG